MTSWVLPLVVAGLIGTASAVKPRMTEVLAWKTISFQLGDDIGGLLVPNVNTVGVERWEDKLFITTPRVHPGLPSTVNYIRLDKLNGSKSPALIPYPSLEANTCDPKAWPPRLCSVVRVRADACDRLWILDCGKVNHHMNKQEAPPKILVYDLKSDKLLFSHVLKGSNKHSFFPSITVDVTSDNCDHAFAYMPDPKNNILIVYNLHTNSSHVLTHNYFYFNPLAGDFNFAGYSWQWQDGIHSLALSPVDQWGYRIVYFRALASTTEFITTTKLLQNTSLTWKQRIDSFTVLGDSGPGSQSSSSFLDEETGVLFYTLDNQYAIGCWNSFKGEDYKTSTQGIIVEDKNTLNWPSDLVVDKQGNLWVLTSSVTDLMFSTINTSAINYRVFAAPVRQVIEGTVCDDI